MRQIRDNIFWVGYIDWMLRNFHGYSTPSGSTYNAYLVRDERPTLIDTVKYYGYAEMLYRIREVIDPAKIEYIISNHTEMDHSGSIDMLLEAAPKATVVCSPKGEEGLRRHFKKKWKFKVVTTGDTLTIGKRTFTFYLAPMVHWPDSMATYSAADKILFSNDAFGQHIASLERYADQIGSDVAFKEAAKYYANIVMPYGPQVLKVLDAVGRLAIDEICTAHGVSWRGKEDVTKIISLYKKWGNYETQKRAIIVYDTMWHSTEKMAYKLYYLLDAMGVPCGIYNLQTNHISDVVTELQDARLLLVGSPILNNRILPAVASFCMYIKGLRPKKRWFVPFGSYGWATAGFGELEASLKEAGMEPAVKGTYIQYVPDDEELAALQQTALKVKELVES